MYMHVDMLVRNIAVQKHHTSQDLALCFSRAGDTCGVTGAAAWALREVVVLESGTPKR